MIMHSFLILVSEYVGFIEGKIQEDLEYSVVEQEFTENVVNGHIHNDPLEDIDDVN